MNTIETSFALMIIFSVFITIVSFSTKNFNNICNNIRKRQVEYSYGYDINYDELKNEYDTIVKPKINKDSNIIKKIYNPEFVLRMLSIKDNIELLNKSSDINNINDKSNEQSEE